MPNLLVRIDAMLVELSEELSPADRSDRWTEHSRDALQAFFQRMRADVGAGKDVSKMPQYVAVVRGLDRWGISCGRLFAEAAAIEKMARYCDWASGSG